MPPPFAHHIWANRVLVGFCATLDAAVLAAVVPGTYGSIRDTVWHMLDAEASYIAALQTGFDPSSHRGVALEHAQPCIGAHLSALERYFASDPAAETPCWWTTPRGQVVATTHGIVLAQILHHGAEHRTQIATVLGSLGIEPPSVSAWEFALATGAAHMKGLHPA
jgi:uncharacterized damage-inducible protein DinB